MFMCRWTLRLFLAGESRGDGASEDGCLRAGFASGTGVESRSAGARARGGTAGGAAAHEKQAAIAGGTRGLSAKKTDCGAGAGSAEGTTRDAALPVVRVSESGGGVHPGRDRLESHTNLARRSPVAHHRLNSN